jgi:hypothetical protein
MSSVRIKLWRDLQDALDDMGSPECAQNPDLFDLELWPDHTEKRMVEKAAKEACARCPAILLCAEYAITAGEVSNIWGGLTTLERIRIKE